MTRPDYFDDPEYANLFENLIMGLAEETRQEHEALAEHGFSVVQVAGSPVLIYRRGDRYYTKEYAIATVRAIEEDRG